MVDFVTAHIVIARVYVVIREATETAMATDTKFHEGHN